MINNIDHTLVVPARLRGIETNIVDEIFEISPVVPARLRGIETRGRGVCDR